MIKLANEQSLPHRTAHTRNNQIDDSIEWTTADPVTGTKGSFNNYGTQTNFTKEEIEPLGQSVQQYDPEEPPQPPQNDPGPINRADDPHWQCSLGAQFYGGFTGMPFHCQQKIFASAGTTLPWENEKVENVQRITFVDSPLPSFDYSPSDEMLNYALGSSSKKDKKPKKEKSGEVKADIGETKVDVNIPALDMTVVPGFADASVSWNDEPLSQEDCDKKIAGLFGAEGAEVATAKDLTIRNGKYVDKNSDRSDHLNKSGVFHIYTDYEGNANKNVGLFIPNGAKPVKPKRKTHGEFFTEGEWKNELIFNYNSGSFKGVTIHLVHVAGTYGGEHDGAFAGKEFINSKNKLIGPQNAAKTATQVGYIGGLGGEGKTEGISRHTHVVIKLNGKRTDPRKIFCSW